MENKREALCTAKIYKVSYRCLHIFYFDSEVKEFLVNMSNGYEIKRKRFSVTSRPTINTFFLVSARRIISIEITKMKYYSPSSFFRIMLTIFFSFYKYFPHWQYEDLMSFTHAIFVSCWTVYVMRKECYFHVYMQSSRFAFIYCLLDISTIGKLVTDKCEKVTVQSSFSKLLVVN